MQPTRPWSSLDKPESYAFATPALREERGSRGVGDASENQKGGPPAEGGNIVSSQL